MLHGLISMRINRPDYAWTESHVDVSLEILLRGLVAPASAAVAVASPLVGLVTAFLCMQTQHRR